MEFVRKMEELDSGELIEASERLSFLTNVLNLEDCDKSFLFPLFPFVDDFRKLSAQTCEAKKIYEGYSLDDPFDGSLFRKMQVLANQLAPRVNAFKAYCELKSQLCLEENDFFYEMQAKVEDRVIKCPSDAKIAALMNLICLIRNIYDVYL